MVYILTHIQLYIRERGGMINENGLRIRLKDVMNNMGWTRYRAMKESKLTWVTLENVLYEENGKPWRPQTEAKIMKLLKRFEGRTWRD